MMKVQILSILFSVLLLYGCSSREHSHEEKNVFYTCSMDPQVMEKKPGICPICNMELTRVVINSEKNDHSITLSEDQIKLGNIKLSKVDSVMIGEQKEFRGVLTSNKDKLVKVTSRIPGRVEKLYFKSKGMFVKKGDRLFDIYSEELEKAIAEYRTFKEKSSIQDQQYINYQQLLQEVELKFQSWDIPLAQVKKMIVSDSRIDRFTIYSKEEGYIENISVEEGQYIDAGSVLYQLADYSDLWAEVEFYQKDIQFFRENSKITVLLEELGGLKLEANIVEVNPVLADRSGVYIANAVLSNYQFLLRPGMRIKALVHFKPMRYLAIPSTAIIHTSNGKMVWKWQKEQVFIPVMVEMGISSDKFVEIVKGLKRGDRVVSSGAYLVNSEYMIRKGVSNSMEGHSH